MGTAHGTVLVRHGGQHDDLGAVAKRCKRFRGTVGDTLPVGLGVKEFTQKCRHLGLFDQTAARRFGDVAGEAERSERQAEAACFEKMRKRPDEFEHDIVDIEHQQGPVVVGKFLDLPRSLGIVAHIECS